MISFSMVLCQTNWEFCKQWRMKMPCGVWLVPPPCRSCR
uniref:Uncharacterized protein n=1 Tax=Arundo donax TaxID=35708 RepID=A0A0A9FP69_ARUDO